MLAFVMDDSLQRLEYSEAMNLLRFHLDVRFKLIASAIIINGALLTVVLNYLHSSFAKIIMSLFGLAICIIFLALTKRSMFLVDSYADYIAKIEEKLKMALLTETRALHAASNYRSRFYFTGLNWILIILWIVVPLFGVLHP